MEQREAQHTARSRVQSPEKSQKLPHPGGADYVSPFMVRKALSIQTVLRGCGTGVSLSVLWGFGILKRCLSAPHGPSSTDMLSIGGEKVSTEVGRAADEGVGTRWGVYCM